jgi:L-threonylcarbamoyladenylate synthase
MKTLLLNSIEKATDLILKGEVVAIPTETVYGLAADALNRDAVKKIFKAKGRPSDNPLIVHIADFEEIYNFTENLPKEAEILAKKFWPGPLTIITKKNNIIPDIVTAGLDSVAIRMPDLNITRDLIKLSGRVLAAPSANLSGRPSPTSYKHVLNDLENKIPAILMGPDCTVGVESTVIDLTSDPICLLRPGKITVEEISNVINKKVHVDKSVDHLIFDLKDVKSPGVKYKHYSPETRVILVQTDKIKFAKFVNSKPECVAMGFDEDSEFIKNSNFISYGSENSQTQQLNKLFDSLRKIDNYNSKIAYVRIPENKKNLNLAVFNRLLRAAAFNIINLK